jgi:PIN domain nuclease of toxin-antitoxin system
MRASHIIDAHPLLWYLGGSPQLGANARRVLNDPATRLVLPATALAEACWVIEQGRVSLTITALMAAIDADPRFEIFPLDRIAIERSTALTSIREMHDRQIVATALVLQDRGETVALVTRDQDITASGLVPVVW